MSSDFDWADKTIIPRQAAVALYLDEDDVIIRQEDDEMIYLSRQSAAILANKIIELLKSTGISHPPEPATSRLISENKDPEPVISPSDILIAQNKRTEDALNKELEEAVAAYNATAKLIGLPECKRLTKRRRSSLSARLIDCGGLAGWADVLQKLTNSPLCRGENERGWVADMDFLLQEKSFQKLIEGSYAKHEPRTSMDSSIYQSRAPVVEPEPDRRELKTEEERKAFVEGEVHRWQFTDGNSHG